MGQPVRRLGPLADRNGNKEERMTVARSHHATSIMLGLAAAIILAAPAAQAQNGAVKAMFEKHKLIGTFAWDCSKPAAKNNLYYVHRLLDADHVQRDQMSSENTRDWTSIIDKAAESGPNQLALSGTLSGRVGGKDLDSKPAHGSWRLEPNRVVQWEVTIDGQKAISGGRYVGNGAQVPWMNRCGG
jgi:hypothetical protein